MSYTSVMVIFYFLVVIGITMERSMHYSMIERMKNKSKVFGLIASILIVALLGYIIVFM